MENKTHIKPLYTCNLSYERKTGVWRLSFLIGGSLAHAGYIAQVGIHAVRCPLGTRTLRLYSSKWKEIAGASHTWMSKNKEVA